MNINCFGCGQTNDAANKFCSGCGATLTLTDFVEREVEKKLAEKTKDLTLVETESAIRIFEKAYGWTLLVAKVLGGVLALLLAGAAWESFDLRQSVKNAQSSVDSTKNSAETNITKAATSAQTSVQSASNGAIEKVRAASGEAVRVSTDAEADAKRQSSSVAIQAESLKKDLRDQGTTVTNDVAAARTQIKAASELQPQMEQMEKGLATAQQQIAEQQRILTSSEDFVKKIFADHKQLIYDLPHEEKSKFVSLDLPPVKDRPDGFMLYLRLLDTPIPETLQVQFNQVPAAPASYFAFHNILLLGIEKSAKEQLLGKYIEVSYFPDHSDKVVINKLEVKDGRVFADGEGLPLFGQADPDFKGSKLVPPPPASKP